MRAVVQRVTSARVTVGAELVGAILEGLCVLVGVGRDDTPKDAAWLAHKVLQARIFRDEEDKMNRSVQDVGGAVLAVSQFTLYGDMRKGQRPSFAAAMEPARALELFNEFCEHCRGAGVPVQRGRFGASMLVELSNDGPVTLLLDSTRQF